MIARLLLFTVLLLASLLPTRPAAAQACVTCRNERCGGMFWIPECKAAKPKPPKPPKAAATSATRCGDDPAQPLTLAVDFPPTVREHDFLGIQIRPSCEAWLIVLYTEDHGGGAVLWPSREEHEPRGDGQHPRAMPSRAEVLAGHSIEAQLRAPGQPSHETFWVFAVADKADFLRARPPAASERPDGAALVAEVRARLDRVPAHRRAEFRCNYVIQPAGAVK